VLPGPPDDLPGAKVNAIKHGLLIVHAVLDLNQWLGRNCTAGGRKMLWVDGLELYPDPDQDNR
jgi:hypothetical protein